MASSSRALTRFGTAATRLSAVEAVARYARPHSTGFATTSYVNRPTLASSAIATNAPRAVSRQLVRTYANAAPAKKKPGKIRTTFKWLWRATYLSLILGVGAVIYDGYLDRHPEEQSAPDPQKKTLVILGELYPHHIM